MMHIEQQQVAVFFQLHKADTEQRRRCEIERPDELPGDLLQPVLKRFLGESAASAPH
jgi:hypothetical protein